jgi:N-acetylglucosaminyldiphosphoundecaprenol N-acetyl-beta-D-mannosaminyltransferase
MTDPRIEILGVPVDRITMDQTLWRIEQMIDLGKPHLLVTADSSGIVQAQSDKELMELYQRADLTTPDSSGVVWAMNRQGVDQGERVSGVEIADRLCRLSGEKNWTIFLLGSSPGVADEAAANLRIKYPDVKIVGSRHGYFKPEQDDEVAREVAAKNPDILLVAMGIPRQEKFILKTMPIIKARVAIGVGGTLDVFSGRAKRAPKLIQKMRMEWLWRLILNPSKFAKTKLLPKFVMMNLRDRR